MTLRRLVLVASAVIATEEGRAENRRVEIHINLPRRS